MNKSLFLIATMVVAVTFGCKEEEESYLTEVIGNWTGTGISLFKCNDSELNGIYEGCLIPGTDRPRPCLTLDIFSSGKYSMVNNINGITSSGNIEVESTKMTLCNSANCENGQIATYSIKSISSNQMIFSYKDQVYGCEIRVELVRI